MVPVSSSLGLVEFVPGTQPLKAAIATFIDAQVHSSVLISCCQLKRQGLPMMQQHMSEGAPALAWRTDRIRSVPEPKVWPRLNASYCLQGSVQVYWHDRWKGRRWSSTVSTLLTWQRARRPGRTSMGSTSAASMPRTRLWPPSSMPWKPSSDGMLSGTTLTCSPSLVFPDIVAAGSQCPYKTAKATCCAAALQLCTIAMRVRYRTSLHIYGCTKCIMRFLERSTAAAGAKSQQPDVF